MANIPRHGKNARLYYNATNMSTMFNEGKLAQTVETAETSVWQDSDKSYIPGIRDATLDLTGLYVGSPSKTHALIDSALGGSTDPIVTYYPEDDVIGRTAKLMRGPVATFTINSPVKDVVSIDAQLQSSTRCATGVVQRALGATTTTAASAAVVGATAATAFGGMAHLHVTAFTATSLTVKVQHSSNGSAWADLITFTNVTNAATRQQHATVTGSVKQQTRAAITTYTGGGSATVAVAFARNRS